MTQQEDDERVGENSFQLRHFSTEERMQINQLRDIERELLDCLDQLGKQKGGTTRYLSLARTNVEQGVMWALREIEGTS